MISCTEFIPSYSELFSYLDETYGRQEVDRFWDYLFKPDGKGIPLVNYVKNEGIRGCFTYWKGTLNEEAADFTIMLNEKAGWYMNIMHHCPSKGRLLDLEKSVGIKPYPYYCLHCDHYRESVAQAGLSYIYNFDGIDHAACRLLIYDPKVFDGRVIVDENTEIMDRKASDNEYFHKDFHSSLNNGLEYLGRFHSEADIVNYLTRFTKNVYRKLIEEAKTGKAAVLEKFIRNTYQKEHAEDALSTEVSGDGKKLEVKVAYCPAVKHLHATGREVSQWYEMSTSVVMQTIAEETGAEFSMGSYDRETGKTEYSFTWN